MSSVKIKVIAKDRSVEVEFGPDAIINVVDIDGLKVNYVTLLDEKKVVVRTQVISAGYADQ
jgi:hypothetical protein